METKRKIEESLALLNSLFAHPNKKRSTENRVYGSTDSLSSQESASLNATTPAPRKRVYLPPRPAVLDKLSRLAASRPTLKDSIAASIAASAPTTHLVSSTTVPPLHTGTKPSFKSEKRRYLPWSRDQFHERLETFKPSTWFDKPKMLNAVECAKHGWINKGDDRLECCGGCRGVVIVRIDQAQRTAEMQPHLNTTEGLSDQSTACVSDNDFDMEETDTEYDMEALGPKFHAMLTDNHEVACPWKAHPCDGDIYKFPVVSQSQAREEFLERVRHLENMADDPLVETIHHPLSKDQVERIASLFPGKDAKLLILSQFGWSSAGKQKVLSCQACHTHCTFIPSPGSSNAGTSSASDIGQDDAAEDEDAAFDVIQSHRWYCYWVDPEYDLNRKEGWRILFDRLTSASTAKSTGSNETPANSATLPME
ncbi:hypothetical protein BGZ58_006647, partial [Dissophora ornata]